MASFPSQLTLSQDYIHEYIGNRLVNTAIAFIVLDTTFVALRCWSRYLQKAPVGWDDLLIIPAYISCLGVCMCGILAVKYGGTGYHLDALVQFAPEKVKYWGRICLIAVPIFYAVSSTLPKMVILAVYLRLFVQKWARIACYATNAVLVAACIVNVILFIWQCSPPDYVWNKTIANGYCRDDLQAHIRWGQLSNVVTDVAMLILPLPVIWRLHISQKEKIGLMATFAVGSVGLVTATVRFAEFLATAAFHDPTWTSVKLVMWACIEPGVYLMAACLLACRPLLHQTIHAGPLSKLWTRIGKTKNYSNLSRTPEPSQDIGLQASPKHAYKNFQSLDDDLENLNPGPRGDGNYAQASGQRNNGTLRMPAEVDRIHVKHEVMLRSDERSAPTQSLPTNVSPSRGKS